MIDENTSIDKFGKLTCAIETLESDVRHFWENYAGEAMYACGKMTDRLAGKKIGFRHLDRILTGKISQITDHCGTINIVVEMSEGYCDVNLSEVEWIGRKINHAS